MREEEEQEALFKSLDDRELVNAERLFILLAVVSFFDLISFRKILGDLYVDDNGFLFSRHSASMDEEEQEKEEERYGVEEVNAEEGVYNVGEVVGFCVCIKCGEMTVFPLTPEAAEDDADENLFLLIQPEDIEEEEDEEEEEYDLLVMIGFTG